jgi:hypothetical protein
MKQQPVRFIDVVLASGPDCALAAVCLYILGAGLELRWLQFVAMMCLSMPVGYVMAFYILRALFDDD